jgi:hypothetical protein|tara:strand:+ start:3409 stop:3720 length:312 start_codon:yes stop_codon:yes gene_type:complete
MENYISRYNFGVKKIAHKGKTTTTSINTTFFDDIKSSIDSQPYSIGAVKEYVKHRPDVISDLFYNTSTYWWYLLMYNNMNDPFNSLNPSDSFLIPVIDELFGK